MMKLITEVICKLGVVAIFISIQLVFCMSASISTTSRTRDNGTLDAPQGDDPSTNQLVTTMNLGSQSSLPCATILTTSYCSLSVPDNGVHFDITDHQFIFYSAGILDQCKLTMQDSYGGITTTEQLPFPGYNWPVVNSVCCECHGCARPTLPQRPNLCAVLFENQECSLCNGFRLEVDNGDEIAVMDELVNDKVSSIFVLPGCELTLFKGYNFMGEGSIATGALNLPYDWNDVVSSYKCSCLDTTSQTPMTSVSPISSTMTASSSPIPPTITSTDIPITSTSPAPIPITSTSPAPLPTTSTSPPPLPTTTTTPPPLPTISTTPEPEPFTTTVPPLTTTETPTTTTSTTKRPVSTTNKYPLY